MFRSSLLPNAKKSPAFLTYYRIYNYISMTVPLLEQELLTTTPSCPPPPPEHMSSPLISSGFVLCYSIFSFMCMFCRSLFVLFSCFFWPFCCLSFFDLRILITSLWYHQTLLNNIFFKCTFI